MRDQAFCTEYACGCINHPLAGVIRKCQGLSSRSLSGRMLPKPDGAEAKHNNGEKIVREYAVASILP